VDYGFRMPLGARQPAAELRGVRAPHQPGDLRFGDAGPYELTRAAGVVVEQLIGRRAGGPEVEVRPVKGQVDDLLEEIRVRAERNERVLVTTLTKRMSEDLAEYFTETGVRCRYLHSEIETLERVESCATCAGGNSTS